MFVPETYGLALLLMILCMICWGSWANTFKLAGKVRFELFYWDYAVGVFVMAIILALTLGSWHGGEDAFFNNLSEATGSRIALAMAAGTIFNVANILLVGAITIAGMAIAFPVAIGRGSGHRYRAHLRRRSYREPGDAVRGRRPRDRRHPRR